MLARDSLMAGVLREPGKLGALSLAQWDVLMPQARRAGMVGRLAWLARLHGQTVAGRPGEYLEGAGIVAARQMQAVRYEVERILSALEGSGTPLILLKGAAYVMAELPCALGRSFTDIDLLVPKQQIAMVERALAFHGWASGHHSPYDQRYYRKWMHEIPPLQHLRRGTVIDLHHAILPPKARIHSDPEPLFKNARLIPGHANLLVLAPSDMILHSATHLFTDGEFNHGLRDLADLDVLIRHFSVEEGFWAQLSERAHVLNLVRPLHYALRYCKAVLDTPVPEALPGVSGSYWTDTLMDVFLGRALAPEHASCSDGLSNISRRFLYIRGHWLRMPMHLLVPHLFYKAFLAEREEESEREKQNGADRPR